MAELYFTVYTTYNIRHKRGVEYRERMCNTPRKPNSRRNTLRPYGAADHDGRCGCRVMRRGGDNLRWKQQRRKAERKHARQQAARLTRDEESFCVDYWPKYHKLSYDYL